MEKHTEYFEGILQIRNLTDEVLDFINSQLKKRQDVFISKTRKVTSGMDFYFSSQHFLQSLGKKLHSSFGGTLKVSKKIHTRDRQRSKDIYRVTVLIELPAFSKGDVISSNGKIVKVTSIRKNVSGFDIKTGKRISFAYIDSEVLEQFNTSVTKVYPSIEVLHPETFQSVKVNNKKNARIGEKVIIVLKEGVWMV